MGFSGEESGEISLPLGLQNLVDQVKGVADEIAIYREDRSVIDDPSSRANIRPGALVKTLHKSGRSVASLAGNREKDWAVMNRALNAAGINPRSTQRLAAVHQDRTDLDGTTFTTAVETLDAHDPNVTVQTEYVRAPQTARVPQGFLSNRSQDDRDPSSINTFIKFGKYVLAIRVGVQLGAMVQLTAERARTVLNRTAEMKTKVQNVLTNNMTTKFIFQREQNKIKVPDGAQSEVMHLLSQEKLIDNGSQPKLDINTGYIEVETTAGKLTIEGVSSAEITTLSAAHSTPNTPHLGQGLDQGIGLSR